MADLNVVVVFYSRTGGTESLALRAAVGAVQARANIRLRRLADSADEATIASSPEWKENLGRMNREFIAPREVDVDWAHALVLGTPLGFSATCAEWAGFFALLGRREGKVGAAFTPSGENESALLSLYAEMTRQGLITVPAPPSCNLESACSLGRRAASVARAVRSVETL